VLLQVLEAMKESGCPRPAIFPLSNPTSNGMQFLRLQTLVLDAITTFTFFALSFSLQKLQGYSPWQTLYLLVK